VTDFLAPENLGPYKEFYLCGSPAMVKDAREKLENA
jgi:NAD(P)H-flavin reductase